jgi:hypothetical protein
MAQTPAEAALNAADTFVFYERQTTGAASRTLYRLHLHMVPAFIADMASALPASASTEERRAYANQRETEKGAVWFRAVDATPKDLRKLSATDLLHEANKKLHGKMKGGSND